MTTSNDSFPKSEPDSDSSSAPAPGGASSGAPSSTREKFFLRKSIANWVFIPQERQACPLLMRLCAGEPGGALLSRADYPERADVLALIREVARGKGLVAVACGNLRDGITTVVLRTKAERKAARAATPAFETQEIDLKWCLFAQDRSSWLECGAGDTLRALESLRVGQWLELRSAPRKEIRSASVSVTRTGERAWHVQGVLTEEWDDIPELADTLGVLLCEQLTEQDGPLVCDERGEGDEGPSAYRTFLAAYNARHGTAFKAVMDESTFRSAVSFSAMACAPGVDLEVSRRVRGDVDRLISALSALEDELLAYAKERWADLEP